MGGCMYLKGVMILVMKFAALKRRVGEGDRVLGIEGRALSFTAFVG